MESRIFRIFLTGMATPWLVAMALVIPCAHAQESEQVVRPELERREVKETDIDTEDFEIGAFAGVMSVDDFGTNLVYGARLWPGVASCLLPMPMSALTDRVVPAPESGLLPWARSPCRRPRR